MPSVLDIQCHAVLTAAASADIGIVVNTNNPVKARASIYAFRKALADPSFADIHIRVSPNDSEHELWVIRRQSKATTQGFTFDNVL